MKSSLFNRATLLGIIVAVGMGIFCQASFAQSSSAICLSNRKAVKVASTRLAEAIKRGGNSQTARSRIKALRTAYRKKLKQYNANCFQDVCGYKPLVCGDGLFCAQMIFTQSYKGLAAMKSDGALLLHAGICLS